MAANVLFVEYVWQPEAAHSFGRILNMQQGG